MPSARHPDAMAAHVASHEVSSPSTTWPASHPHAIDYDFGVPGVTFALRRSAASD